MTSQTFTASILALAIESPIAPVEAAARSGGFIPAPSSPLRGANAASVAIMAIAILMTSFDSVLR
jgi:hypothetical protein